MLPATLKSPLSLLKPPLQHDYLALSKNVFRGCTSTGCQTYNDWPEKTC